MLTFPLAVIAALTFIACLRYKPGGRRRRDRALLSAVLTSRCRTSPKLHADIGCLIGALAAALAIGLHFTGLVVQ